MKIPKKLKVGGHTIEVVYPYHFKERNDLAGQFDNAMKEIRLSGVDNTGNKRAKSDVFVTFLHETLHAIDMISGHEVFKDNEPAIEGLSEGIFQVLVDNGFLKIE